METIAKSITIVGKKEDSSYTYILDSGFRALTTSQFPEFILEAIV